MYIAFAAIMAARWCQPTTAAPLDQHNASTTSNVINNNVGRKFPKAHHCIHDDPHLQKEQELLLAQPPAKIVFKNENARSSRRQNEGRMPLRISTSMLDLEDSSRFCTQQGGTAPTFQGGKMISCLEEDVLNAEKKDILVNKVIPESLSVLMNAFTVSDDTSEIKFPSGFKCGDHSVPPSHDGASITGTDYVTYVAAGPTSASNLAWAGPCLMGSQGRPVAGRANFGPMHMQWDTPDQRQMQIDTAVHELLHALGFTNSFFKNMIKTVSLRGKEVTVLSGPKLTQLYRELADCSTLEGPELEDEGGSGSAGSHWDRRVLADELMTGAGGDQFSALSLALFDDMGFYEPNYTTAKALLFGRAAGCAFHTNKCNDAAAGKDRWFCFEQDNSIFSKKTQCTYDNRGIGTCSVSNVSETLPLHFQYFPGQPRLAGPMFLDRCPVVVSFPNRRCDIDKTPSTTEQTLGHYFGDGGRCWDTTGVIKEGFVSTSADGARCLVSQCVGGRPAFRVNDDWWKVCPTDGAEMCDLGVLYKGCVKCPPNAAEFCPGVKNIDALDEEPITPAPQKKSSPSITGFVRLEGENWPRLLNDTEFSVMLQNALREDIANWCEIDLEDSLLEAVDLQPACKTSEPIKGPDGNDIKCTIVVLIGFVTFRWTPFGLEDRFEEAAVTGGADWMPLTRDLYNETLHQLHNGTDEWQIQEGDLPRITGSEMSFNRNFCADPLDPNEDYCLPVILGLLVATSVCICLTCCCYRCVRRKITRSRDAPSSNPLKPNDVHFDSRNQYPNQRPPAHRFDNNPPPRR